MPGPGADMGEAEFLENAPEPHFGEINTEAFAKNALQVLAAPARHPVLLRIRPCLHELAQVLFLLRRKFRRTPRRLDIDETVGTLLIEAMHPVPQRLPIHAADAGCLLAIHPLVYRRDREQSPRLIDILHDHRQAPQLFRLKIIPKGNRRAHLRLPNQSDQAEMNHTAAPISKSQPFLRLVLDQTVSAMKWRCPRREPRSNLASQ